MRPFDRRPFPADRKFVTAAMRAGRKAAPMTALVQVDVTDAWRRIREDDLSATAFVMACVGRAVAEHPEVHAYRDWFGRLVMHRHVDVATMVEVETKTGAFPLAHPIQDTDLRTVSDLSGELHKVRENPSSGRSGMMLLRWGRQAARVPGLASLVYFLGRRSVWVRSGVGTVAVSSVGMMIGGSGFATSVPSISTISVLIGGATERPWAVDGEVVVRRILDLSVQIDHRMVDGAPAARFGATLRRLLENPDLVDW